MRKLTILSILALVLVLLVAPSIQAGSLNFKEVKVYVDGKKKSVGAGGTVSNAKPESPIKFQITMENTFTSAENVEIEDIIVEAVVKGIKDDDDEELESKEFNLNPASDRKVSFGFDVPLEVDDSTYVVKLTAEGTSVNGSTRTKVFANMTFGLEVEKKKHEMRFYKKLLNPTTLSCGKSAELTVGVTNTGKENEDDVFLEVSNEALGLKQKVGPLELDSGSSNDDVKATKQFKVLTTKELAPGTYPLSLKASFNKEADSKSDSVDLTVTACEEKKVEEKKVEEKKAEEKKEVVEVKTQVTPAALPTTPAAPALTSATTAQTPAKSVPPVSLSSSKKEPSFLENYGTGLVVLLYVVVVVVAVALFGLLFRRRD